MIPVLAIPVLNRYDLLDRLIDSIDYSVKEIFIINNGKEKYIPKNKNFNVRVIDLPSNLGVAGSWNLAIKLYPHLKYWCFSSADSIFEKGEFKKMVDLSSSDKLCLSTHYTSSFSIGVFGISRLSIIFCLLSLDIFNITDVKSFGPL